MAFEFEYPTQDELEKIVGLDLSEIRDCNKLQAKSYKVDCFTQLVYLVSLLRVHNKKFFILYRGESKQHFNNDVLSFLPGIYRDEKKYNDNLQFLKEKTKELLKLEELKQIHSNKTIIAHSLLQHYEITPTPYLDLTQSLRVAYSIALDDVHKKNRETIYLYLFAVPFPNRYITRRDNILLVNLMSTCPPNAFRPHLQEGFVIKYNEAKHDFNQHLIAEIRINKTDLENPKKFLLIGSASTLNNYHDIFKNCIEDLKQDNNQIPKS